MEVEYELNSEEGKKIEERISRLNDPNSEESKKYEASLKKRREFTAPLKRAIIRSERLTERDYRTIVY